MNLLAHNGVSHQSAIQAATHGTIHPLVAGLLVTIAVLSVIAVLVYLVHTYSPITLPINDKEDKK